MASTTPFAGARLAIIGAGAMAEAMLAGMLHRGVVQPGQVICSHPRAQRREELERDHGVATTPANAEAAAGADVVLLAIKPQMLPEVMPELRTTLEAALEAVTLQQRERLRRAGESLAARRPALAGAAIRLDLMALAPGRWPRHIPDAWRGS